jgi:hypothetical protein
MDDAVLRLMSTKNAWFPGWMLWRPAFKKVNKGGPGFFEVRPA